MSRAATPDNPPEAAALVVRYWEKAAQHAAAQVEAAKRWEQFCREQLAATENKQAAATHGEPAE